MNTIQDLMTEGDTDPVLFELLGVFQEGIGCDRVSDLITFILREDMLKYTQRVTEFAGVDSLSVSFGHKIYNGHPKALEHFIAFYNELDKEIKRKISYFIIDATMRPSASKA